MRNNKRVECVGGKTDRQEEISREKTTDGSHSHRRKGFVHIDYIIAIGVIIVVFALSVQFATSFFTPAQEEAQTQTVTANAFSLLSMADFSSSPRVWNDTSLPERIGLYTKAYRFLILVNNTGSSYLNQSQSVINLSNELVNFSFSDLGYSGININSTVVLDDNNRTLSYQISGEEIRFAAIVNASAQRWYVVYFDDDSNFTSRSASVAVTNNLSERIYPTEQINIVQYQQMNELSVSNYTLVRNATSNRDFHIRLRDVNTSANQINYGADEPRRGTVVALQRFVMYQNATANVNQGRLIVQTW